MELIIHNECGGHRRRNGLEFRCSVCNYGVHVNGYDRWSVRNIRTLMMEHLLYSHFQSEVIINMVNKMFEKIGEYKFESR